MSSDADTWFYAVGGEQQGPVPFHQIRIMVQAGTLDPADLVWNESMTDWKPYREVAPLEGSPAAPSGGLALEQPAPGISRWPIPADLKRASFTKLMIVAGTAVVLFLTCVGLIITYFDAGTGGGSFLIGGVIAGIACLVVFIWGLVLSMIYLYRGWKMLQPFGASITPGIAVGFLFIPFFNLYWAFRSYYGWSKDYNATVNSDERFSLAPRSSEPVFLAYCISQLASIPLTIIESATGEAWASFVDGSISIVGLILLAIMMFQICNAVNFFVELRDREDHMAEAQRSGSAS